MGAEGWEPGGLGGATAQLLHPDAAAAGSVGTAAAEADTAGTAVAAAVALVACTPGEALMYTVPAVAVGGCYCCYCYY